jgi:hypothetical protein
MSKYTDEDMAIGPEATGANPIPVPGLTTSAALALKLLAMKLQRTERDIEHIRGELHRIANALEPKP